MLTPWILVIMTVTPLLPSGASYPVQTANISIASLEECIRIANAVNATASTVLATCQSR